MFHTTVMLDHQVLREMQSHATSTYPEECCGLLIGKFEGNLSRKLVSRIKRMDNVFEKRERYHRYRIDPLKYMDAENEATSSGEDVIGIYHSHPNAPAKPSLFDKSYAWPSLSYIVIEVRDSVPVETKSWILKDDRTEFIQENMEIQSE